MKGIQTKKNHDNVTLEDEIVKIEGLVTKMKAKKKSKSLISNKPNVKKIKLKSKISFLKKT